ncbi:NlpC/P60 family N-terminal domain-containing protein [Paraburkholderia sediminicola]|uniref:NlpC/P60 family N-terminal domain-containing protein n=1 Tax=Paraburkholderia rhynchosiae TaxID=487049 RepID=A0ACC7NGI7_9BURK
MSVAVLFRRLAVSWPGARRAAALCAAAAILAACSGPPPARDVRRQAHAFIDTVTLFPLEHYDQNVDHWLQPGSPAYDQPFLSPEEQREHFDALFARYFGTGAKAPSPWNSAYVTQRVYREQGADIAALQQRRIDRFDNTGKQGAALGYGENFRPHDKAWIDAIARNMNVEQFTRTPVYRPERRAIATGNLMVRELPTTDPSFYDHHLAGEGYPFDNLQISAVRPGTPLYVLGGSDDGAWQYVQTPDVQGWVRSDGVALADDRFVDAWRAAAGKSLGAVTVASVPVRDSSGAFRFDAPVGTMLPLLPASPSALPQQSVAGTNGARQAASAGVAVTNTPGTVDDTRALRTVLVPARDPDGRALIRTATLSDTQIAPMPLAATPRHLAMLMKALIGRPYGWGNSGLYNDCSSELQSIFAVFGVWLPRHSSTQMSAGRLIDLSTSTPAQRLDYLARHGEPLRTLIYIGGHVMLYIGNTTRDGVAVPVVYQDVWGLRPADDSRRAVIGGSVILPLYEHIPEDASLQSLAATRTFQISILGAPDGVSAPPSAPPDEDNPAG